MAVTGPCINLNEVYPYPEPSLKLQLRLSFAIVLKPLPNTIPQAIQVDQATLLQIAQEFMVTLNSCCDLHKVNIPILVS